MTFEELARKAAAGAPELTEEQERRLVELLRPNPAAAARHRHHELKRRRRLSKGLDEACGREWPAPDPSIDLYRDGRLSFEQRDALGRSA